jgi:hypothetical protein
MNPVQRDGFLAFIRGFLLQSYKSFTARLFGRMFISQLPYLRAHALGPLKPRVASMQVNKAYGGSVPATNRILSMQHLPGFSGVGPSGFC